MAIDVRGYGRSAGPADVAAYGMLAHVADNVGVVRALGAETAAVVGHDWGSPIAAASALLRPDVFTAVGLLSVPYVPPGGPRPTSALAAAGGEEEFYVSYFQEPGRAESEIELDVRGWLAGFYTALSGGGGPAAGYSVFTVPTGGTMRDRFPEGTTSPRRLGEDDLKVHAREFERTGFTGALNRDRNMDRDRADPAAWDGAVIRQPSRYVAGEPDASTTWLAAAIADHPAHPARPARPRGQGALEPAGGPGRGRPVARRVAGWAPARATGRARSPRAGTARRTACPRSARGCGRSARACAGRGRRTRRC